MVPFCTKPAPLLKTAELVMARVVLEPFCEVELYRLLKDGVFERPTLESFFLIVARFWDILCCV